jgi:hypothetical protein
LVVVVKAEPIFTLRKFWPSAPRETMAGAASVAPAAARMWRRNMVFSPSNIAAHKMQLPRQP